MKKFDIKSLIAGFIIGTIGVTTVLAAGEIKSTTVSKAKVYFYGKEITLKEPLVEIVKDGSSDAQLYMPMKDIMEYMHFNVDWSAKDNSVNLTMKGSNISNSSNIDNKDKESLESSSKNDADTKAIDIIQKTGNWKYIEQYLPQMTSDGIKKVVEIYNSKHINPSEHKKASDYIKN